MPARRASSDSELRTHFQTLVAPPAAGHRVEANVPCNGCVACRYHRKVDLMFLDLLADPDAEMTSGMILCKRSDGACTHLVPRGCAAREHSPLARRLNDCRLSGMVGIVASYAGSGHGSSLWASEQRTTFDRLLTAALQFTVMQLTPQRGGGREASPSAGDVYTKAARMIHGLMEFAHRLERLSSAGKAAIAKAPPALKSAATSIGWAAIACQHSTERYPRDD